MQKKVIRIAFNQKCSTSPSSFMRSSLTRFCLDLITAILTVTLPLSLARAADDLVVRVAPKEVPTPAYLITDPTFVAPSANGLVVIKFRAENVKIAPVYGDVAASAVPRIGHLHVTVDGEGWHWLHSSDEPIIIRGLVPGAHKVRIDLTDANHVTLDSSRISFEIPRRQ